MATVAELRTAFPELREAISSGRCILVVGDRPVSASSELAFGATSFIQSLRHQLLSVLGLATAGEGQALTLQQLLEMSRAEDPSATAQAIDRLEVPSTTTAWIRLLAGPWKAIYEVTGARLDLPADLATSVVDGTTDFDRDVTKTQVVRLCGSGQTVSFEVPTGVSNSPRDIWHRQFSADIVSHPVLFVATAAHPELWQLVAARKQLRGSDSAPAFLVVSAISQSDTLLCRSLSFAEIFLNTEELVGAFLDPSHTDVSEGRRRLAQTRQAQPGASGPRLVSALIQQRSDDDKWRFLRGYDPRWADVVAGRTVRLSRLKTMHKVLGLDAERRNIVLVKGRAGSGKTTALMRFAYELESKGRVVLWLDRSVGGSVSDIQQKVNELDPDIVVIDDVDMFGDAAERTVRSLNRAGRTAVVGTLRRSLGWTVEGINATFIDGDTDLTDVDLERLCDSLESAGLLGSLVGLRPRSARVAQLRTMCERDLLSALIEVVTGQPFEARVASELSQLHDIARRLYAAVCMSQYIHETDAVPEEDLLQAIGSVDTVGRYAVAATELLDVHRLVVRDRGGLRARHRAIADAVVRACTKVELASFVQDLLTLYATRSAHIRGAGNVDRRLLVHLLSHREMIRLRLNPTEVRRIYEAVQQLLSEDFHYWLQRGAFEVEHDELDLAESYLKSARACEGGSGDHLVTTEWGFMSLRRALSVPNDSEASEKAAEAMKAMMVVIRTAGRNSPHTFSVLIGQGSEWLSRSSLLTSADIHRNLSLLEEAIEIGKAVCQGNQEVMRTIRKAEPKLRRLRLADLSDRPRFPLV